ncbi:MAG: TylF/MycF/NovP-related O-methyltransferase [Myxococcota bacterium]
MSSNVRYNNASTSYQIAEAEVRNALQHPPMPPSELLENLYLFLTPQHLRRVFFFYELYQRVLTVPGSIVQFGVRWGRDLALFDSLRTTFEPFNHGRRIVGFDTFDGFPEVDDQDGMRPMVRRGNFATKDGYRVELEAFLRSREALSPLGHLQKFDLVEGDANETLEAYLTEHPETVVALAHFDMDLYRPTRRCLELLRQHVTKGSIIVLDELACREFPGETVALREVFGLRHIRLERHPQVNPTWPAFFVVE